MRRRSEWGEKARAWFDTNEREIMAGLPRGNTTNRSTRELALKGKYGELVWSDLYRIPVDMSADINTHKKPDAVHPRSLIPFDVKSRTAYTERADGTRTPWRNLYLEARLDHLEEHPDYRLQLVAILPEEVIVAGGLVSDAVYAMAMDASTKALTDTAEIGQAFARADLPVFIARDRQRVMVNVRHDLLRPLHDWESACGLEPDLAARARSWP